MHDHRLGLVGRGVTGRHGAALVLGRGASEKSVALLAGRLLQRELLLLRHATHVALPDRDRQIVRVGELSHEALFSLRHASRAQTVIVVRDVQREVEALLQTSEEEQQRGGIGAPGDSDQDASVSRQHRAIEHVAPHGRMQTLQSRRGESTRHAGSIRR